MIDNVKVANSHRDILKRLYSKLKTNDKYIRFVFITGITKFSKASIFSGLNQLEDISLMPRYATICGYTQNDIETKFKEYLIGANLDKVKEWYNGYNFLGDNVYNPFDILKFIRNDFKFSNYWWESGNPFSLIEVLKTKKYYLPSLENLKTDESLINSFDIENLQLESLLFQAGYLTIDKVVEDEFDIEYRLKVPNLEVQMSLNRLFINYLVDNVDITMIKTIRNSLLNKNLDEFKETLHSLFASIPYNNYIKNKIASVEGYWASLVYCYLTGAGLKVVAEDVTSFGRIDLTIIINSNIYIIEFKMKDSKNPLTQIKEKKYYEKYQSQITNNQYKIYLVGIEFDEEIRNISGFEWERVGE
jgi:hypothetical protein